MGCPDDGDIDGLPFDDSEGLLEGEADGAELGLLDKLGGALGAELGSSLGGKITVANSPPAARDSANLPLLICSSFILAASSVLTPVNGGAVIVRATFKQVKPVRSIPVSSAISLQAILVATASTITELVSCNTRLVAVALFRLARATATYCTSTSAFVTLFETAAREVKVVDGVSVGTLEGVVLGSSDGRTDGGRVYPSIVGTELELGEPDGCPLGTAVGTCDGTSLGIIVGIELGISDST